MGKFRRGLRAILTIWGLLILLGYRGNRTRHA